MEGESSDDRDNSEGVKLVIPMMSDEDLNQLARDMESGVVFSHMHLDSPNDMSLVFMPLVLMNERQHAEFIDSCPGMIYEYVKDALPRAVNGLPLFASFRTLNIPDTNRLIAKIEAIRAATDRALAETAKPVSPSPEAGSDDSIGGVGE